MLQQQFWGGFAPTGDMTVARDGHTATLFPDGTVLIAGGANFGEVLASAELYNPTTRIFVATGSMSAQRVLHTATLLLNGKVLIAGGNYFIGAAEAILASAELYDPATGTFTTTGSMMAARDAHAATLLPNGTVLVAGGGAGRVTVTGAGNSTTRQPAHSRQPATYRWERSATQQRYWATGRSCWLVDTVVRTDPWSRTQSCMTLRPAHSPPLAA